MPYLTLTETSKATTKSWFSPLPPTTSSQETRVGLFWDIKHTHIFTSFPDNRNGYGLSAERLWLYSPKVKVKVIVMIYTHMLTFISIR